MKLLALIAIIGFAVHLEAAQQQKAPAATSKITASHGILVSKPKTKKQQLEFEQAYAQATQNTAAALPQASIQNKGTNSTDAVTLTQMLKEDDQPVLTFEE